MKKKSILSETNWPNLIKYIIEFKGLSQTELADKVGVTQQAISNITSGTRGPGNALRRNLRDLLKTATDKTYEDFSEPKKFELTSKTKPRHREILELLDGMPRKKVKTAIEYLQFLSK